MEEIQSIIRTYFYDIDSINDINRNINIEVIKYHSLKESVQSGEPKIKKERKKEE